MKKILVLCMSLMFCFFVVAPGAFADTEGEATAGATVEVIPNITIAQDPTGFDMGAIQTGLFTGAFLFRVDANLQYVDIGVSASDLFKGGETGGEVLPIPVANGAGVGVDPEFSTAQTLSYECNTVVSGLDGSQFAMSTFESTQSGHFSADIDVVVTWNQDDPEKPQGDYSGYVKLFACIIP